MFIRNNNRTVLPPPTKKKTSSESLDPNEARYLTIYTNENIIIYLLIIVYTQFFNLCAKVHFLFEITKYYRDYFEIMKQMCYKIT